MNAQNPKILLTSTNMKDLLITRIVIWGRDECILAQIQHSSIQLYFNKKR